MFAGALSRAIAQTAMQPANVVKTLLQGRSTSGQLKHLSFKLLTRGAGAQFLLSLPHGAFNFATLEAVKEYTSSFLPAAGAMGPVLDFFSSTVATTICSIISTPQMVITDRIMADIYPNLASAVRTISQTEGLKGFYAGWGPNLAQKIPSYGLTWVFFQQFKLAHQRVVRREPTNGENFALGAAAAGATVCILIPLDTAKTRIVTQVATPGLVPYTGVVECIQRVIREEGIGTLYKALGPRLASVVPMIGIQFGVYEYLKRELLKFNETGHTMVGRRHRRRIEDFFMELAVRDAQLI
ncbi:mitochondrial energy transfer protein [Tribonema minus]|uniref:Mitochondrial energy transfer protein n=1 Tax=Tribonema minus TaxID=303371 RepID=A0A835Z5P9_9STRA|nr:mitochondrial energy transfer protein [Tribonema minus]